MPKKAPELSDLAVRKLRHGTVKGDPKVKAESRRRDIGQPTTAYHPVGGVAGLLLQCRPPQGGEKIGSRSWILRVKIGTKRRDIGLGGYPDVPLSQAREEARRIKQLIRDGIDPVEQRRQARMTLESEQRQSVTLKDQAQAFIQRQIQDFRGANPAKQQQRLENQINTYIVPIIGNIYMRDLKREHVLQVLNPIWHDKHETAKRVRNHIERIYGMARAAGVVDASAPNPAEYKDNLDHHLATPESADTTNHYPSCPWHLLPRFMDLLQQREGFPARALEFEILTQTRPGEIRFAQWDEIDLNKAVWTIPGKRMKNRKNDQHHKIPLSNRALAILNNMPRLNEYVFPGYRGKDYMSENALRNTALAIHKQDIEAGGEGFFDEQFGKPATAHGFRSTFRVWAQENTSYAEEVSELCLAHLDSSSTQVAYKRGQALDKRRRLIGDYERYAYKGEQPQTDNDNNVTSIGAATA